MSSENCGGCLVTRAVSPHPRDIAIVRVTIHASMLVAKAASLAGRIPSDGISVHIPEGQFRSPN